MSATRKLVPKRQIPLIAGCEFNPHDDAQAPRVTLVNQSAAVHFWPNQNPIGKRVWVGDLLDSFEVAGVVGDTRNVQLVAPPEPEVFLPLSQMTSPYVVVSARTAFDPHGMVGAMRHQIAAVDRDQPVTQVKTMEEWLESLSAQPRFTMFLLGTFSAAALLLAVVGLYALIAYSVAQRTGELGIRIALGASGMKLAMAGIAIGIAASLLATRLLSGLLFETSATDPVAFAASAALFVAVAIVASYLPARRAARIDPAVALRSM